RIRRRCAAVITGAHRGGKGMDATVLPKRSRSAGNPRASSADAALCGARGEKCDGVACPWKGKRGGNTLRFKQLRPIALQRRHQGDRARVAWEQKRPGKRGGTRPSRASFRLLP